MGDERETMHVHSETAHKKAELFFFLDIIEHMKIRKSRV